MNASSQAVLLIGTHMHPCGEETMRRQRRALLSLTQLPGCHAVNLQFSRDWKPLAFPGLENLDVLSTDSCETSRAGGIRKPIFSDLFHQLAIVARSRGIPYFGFINSDIILLPAMAEEVTKAKHECYMASRKDVDPAGAHQPGYLVHGVDVWIMSLKFYDREGWRLPAAIVGEFGGDNLCAAIALTHGDGFLINHRTVCLHELHDNKWLNSPFAEYNHLQCIRHGAYFSAWARYIAKVTTCKGRDTSDAEALQIQKTCFARKPNLLDRALQMSKLGKWKAIYWWKRRRNE